MGASCPAHLLHGRIYAFGSRFGQRDLYLSKDSGHNTANDATLNDDPHLQIPIAVNEILVFELCAFWTAGAGGIQVAFNGPAAPTNLRYVIALEGAGSMTTQSVAAWDTVVAIAGADNGFVSGWLSVENGVNAGNVIVRWAQQAANAANTTLQRGSWFRSYRL